LIRHNNRYKLSKAIVTAKRKTGDAAMIFSVFDELLVESGDRPVLAENRAHIDNQFNVIGKAFQEIVITLAEDKHGRIRNK